jgi:hypothetical protein
VPLDPARTAARALDDPARDTGPGGRRPARGE